MRTALLAIIGFMPTKGEGAIGALDYTPEERRTLAKRSLSFTCTRCNTTCATALLPEQPSITSPISTDNIITTPTITPANNTNNTQEQITKTTESTNVIIPPQNQQTPMYNTHITPQPHVPPNPTQNNIQPQIPMWVELFREHAKVLDYLVVVLVVLIAALVLRKNFNKYIYNT